MKSFLKFIQYFCLWSSFNIGSSLGYSDVSVLLFVLVLFLFYVSDVILIKNE